MGDEHATSRPVREPCRTTRRDAPARKRGHRTTQTRRPRTIQEDGMSKRLETIKRLAETDDYWKGYLDGLNRTREADAVEWREYARLMQARLARAVDDVADRSEFRPVDEVRARLRARRLDRSADTTDYDAEWTPRAPNARDEWDGCALCGRSRAP